MDETSVLFMLIVAFIVSNMFLYFFVTSVQSVGLNFNSSLGTSSSTTLYNTTLSSLQIQTVFNNMSIDTRLMLNSGTSNVNFFGLTINNGIIVWITAFINLIVNVVVLIIISGLAYVSFIVALIGYSFAGGGALGILAPILAIISAGATFGLVLFLAFLTLKVLGILKT